MTERIQSAHDTLGQAHHLPTDPFSGFAEAVPIPVVLLASDTRIRYANTAFVQTLGLKKEHYQHRKFPGHWLMSPQEGLSQLRELLHQAVQPTAHPEPVRLSLRSSDGTEIATEVHARPLPSIEQGPASLTVLTFRKLDPSETLQQTSQSRENDNAEHLQDELKHSEERLRILFEYAPDAYYLNDLKGNFIDGNKAAEEMVGYKRQELIGKSFLKLNLLPKSQIPKAARSLVKNAVGKPTGPDEFTLRRKDGSTVPVEVRTYPVRIGGRVLILGIARDITEHKRAQEELLREKAFSDSVINSMPGVFYMFDETGKYVWWNRQFEAITEYSAAEIRNIHPTTLCPEANQGRVAERITRAFTEGTATIEGDLVSKSGLKTPYFFTGVRIERNGKPYLIGLGIDITERRKAQVVLEQLNEDLQQSVRELERSNRELGDFAHVTAHDLKAPLRGIGTLVDWLDQDHGEQIGPEGRESLHLLRGRVDRMGHLINGILRYSEIGHDDRSVAILDTHAMVQEVIEQIAPPENIEIQIENTLPPVTAERTRLTQVLQNLIGNAVKYIDKPQGQIRISTRDDGDFWEFCVADNGPGIEAKHFGRIFQMFQTLSTGDRSNSTGLGLAMVKKIVDMYGGRVWLESEMGHGSAFFFTLPKHHKSVAQGKT